jgi:hypothetical protein
MAEWLAAYARQIDNMRAALNWAFSATNVAAGSKVRLLSWRDRTTTNAGK